MPDPDQPSVALLMPAREQRPTWQDGALFAVMDQSLPEGELLLRLSMMFPKDRLQPMHLLAMMGQNGIGNLGYTLPGAAPTSRRPTSSANRCWRCLSHRSCTKNWCGRISVRALASLVFSPRSWWLIVRPCLSPR